jgi:4-amino-4-deoxy-L-arabinose transferase
VPWFAIVTVVAAALLLTGLGDGEFRPYDEGLYGKLARNALTHERWLHAVDADGEFFDAFSKPPLSLWATAASLSTVGMSLTGLRLPFALSMLATIWIAFGWGRRIGGLPLAVAWSSVLTVSAATLRWGRHACIEPMFLAGIMLGLWAYHEAYRGGPRALRWAALSGLALAVAVLTKQLAVGIAVLPIVALEIWRRAGREALPRLALALGIPFVVGIVWLALAYASVGSALVDTLFTVGVKTRVEGFATGHNARSLNEVATVIGEALAPWSWPLGVAGLAILTARSLGSERRRPDGAVLLPMFFATVVLVYDNVASSMLPWYAFDFVPPLACGLGCVLAAIVSPPATSSTDRVALVLGWTALGMAAIAGLARIASQLDAALLAGVLLVAALAGRRFAAGIRGGLLVVVGLVLVAASTRDREFQRPSEPFAPWMTLFAERDLQRVAVLERMGLVSHEYGTFFGPGVELVRSPPWPTQDYDVFITPEPVPMELVPPEGMQVLRVPGATAFVGDLSARSLDGSTIGNLLEQGPITFEAELLPGDGDRTIAAWPDASGGLVRRHVPFRNEKTGKFALTKGPQTHLPAGNYEADVHVAWDCAGREGDAATLQVFAKGSRVAIRKVVCSEGTGALEPVTLSFKLDVMAKVDVRVVYRSGDLAHDRTVIRKLR